MKIIGLDVSTHTGISIMENSAGELNHVTFEIEFKNRSGMLRLVLFRDWLKGILKNHAPDLVVFEGYGLGHMGSVVTLVEIGTVLRLVCYELGYPSVEVAPTMLKKFATGKGNANKELVMMNALKHYGFEAKTNNEADAYILARIGAVLKGIDTTNNRLQEEVIQKILSTQHGAVK